MTTADSLTSLAMLKVDLDNQHRTYVDYISPFIVDILNEDKPEIISDSNVADKLRSRFGLQVPTRGVQQILRRMQKKGYLALENGIFVVTSSVPTSTLSRSKIEAERHIESVVLGVIKEAAVHHQEWSPEVATQAITAFLGRFTVDCLRTYVFNTALPTIPEKNSANLYIVSKFVTKAQERRDFAFESFIVLVKGLMYSNALLCPDLESLEKKFQDLTFYLDTPLLLNLLGLQGKDAKRSAEELIELLKKLRGSLAVFSHTITETQQVIGAAASNLNNPRANGKVIEEARRNGFQLSDLIIARDTVDERMRKIGISVKRTPDYVSDYQIDETEFQQALSEEVYYKGESALLNDINSVRSIYVLRQGRQPVRLEDAGVVFVTTNQTFAKAAFHAGRNHNSTREISSVITAYSLANIAWLKSPLEAPTLPLSETMALCYAALEPSPDLFKKYVQEMEKLRDSGQISTRDHEILRLSPLARDELMELTLGDEHALTVSSIKSILENVKVTMLAEQKQTHEAELAALSKQGDEQLSEAQQRELLLSQRASAAEAAADEAARQAEILRVDLTRRQEARNRRYQRIAHKITLGVIWAGIALLLAGALAGSGLVTPSTDASPTTKLVYPSLALIAVLWGVYSWHTGATVKQVARRLEDWLTKKLCDFFEHDGEV